MYTWHFSAILRVCHIQCVVIIYMLFTSWEVWIEKYFVELLTLRYLFAETRVIDSAWTLISQKNNYTDMQNF